MITKFFRNFNNAFVERIQGPSHSLDTFHVHLWLLQTLFASTLSTPSTESSRACKVRGSSGQASTGPAKAATIKAAGATILVAGEHPVPTRIIPGLGSQNHHVRLQIQSEAAVFDPDVLCLSKVCLISLLQNLQSC